MNKKMLIASLVLVGVLAVMICLILILVPVFQQRQYENAQTTTTVETTPAPENLGSRTDEEILKVTVEREDERFVFSRDSYRADWVLEAHPDLELNQGMISSMASNASAGIVNQDIQNSLDNLAQFGLDPAVAKVTVEFTDGDPQVIYLGNLTVKNNTCYAYLEGDNRVVTLGNTLYNYATSPLYAFALAKDFVIDGTAASMMRVSSGDKILLEAHRLGKGTMSVGDYKITKPYEVLASTEFSAKFAEELTSISLSGMADVSDDNLAKYGLDNPAYTLTVEYGSSIGGTGDFTMYIGNLSDSGDVYYVIFEGESTVYTVSAWSLRFITELNTFNLVNRLFMLYAIGYVDEVRVHTPDTDALLTLIQPEKGSNARVTFKLDGEDVNRAGANLWYQSIITISSAGVLPEDYKPGEPEISVHFTYLPGNPVAENLFEFIPYEKDYYAVQVDGDAQFYCRREKVENMVNMLAQLRAGELDAED